MILTALTISLILNIIMVALVAAMLAIPGFPMSLFSRTSTDDNNIQRDVNSIVDSEVTPDSNAVESTPSPTEVVIPSAVLEQYKVGAAVQFGNYPQETDGSSKSIAWQVLDNDGRYVRLISTDVLDAVFFDDQNQTDWGKSSIRLWLNSSFLDSAFSAEEKAALFPDNLNGDSTFFVGMLSSQEVETYFKETESRIAKATGYAETVKKADTKKVAFISTHQASWRTSSGDASSGMAYMVNADGALVQKKIDTSNIGVRPVIVLDLASDMFRNN